MGGGQVKIYCNGSRFWGGQLDRIEDGFRALGHEVTEHVSEGDLVYSNNSHTQLVKDKANGILKPGAKTIFNVLDIPEHLFPSYDPDVLDGELWQADAVTCISQFVQGQMLRILGRKDVPIIYQPVKPVARNTTLRIQPFYRFAHVGRRHDFNKRYGLATAALDILGFNREEPCLVGSEHGQTIEYASRGTFLGVLRDADLNVVYNSVDFVFALGRIEGLSLTPLEAMAAGAIPIVCRDMSTRTELLPPDLFPEYETIEPTPPSIACFIASLVNDESGIRMANLKQRLHDHYVKTWEARTTGVAVAQRILDVYTTL